MPAQDGPREQRRGRKIAMSGAELDQILGVAWTCRVASISSTGPHVMPLWFVWVDGKLWLHSLSRSQRWKDIERDPRIAVVVDLGGHDFGYDGRHAWLRLTPERVYSWDFRKL